MSHRIITRLLWNTTSFVTEMPALHQNNPPVAVPAVPSSEKWPPPGDCLADEATMMSRLYLPRSLPAAIHATEHRHHPPGLVLGKTNAIRGLGTKDGVPEPKLWLHHVPLPDGTPYKPEKIDAIRQNHNSQQ